MYAEKVPNARSMTLSPSGILFVGTRREGNVYAVIDKDKDQKADEVITIASGLNMPNGVAFRDGHLYVAEVNRIIRFDYIEQNLSAHRNRLSFLMDIPPIDIMVGNLFGSDQMVNYMCRSAHPAIYVKAKIPYMPA